MYVHNKNLINHKRAKLFKLKEVKDTNKTKKNQN